MKNKPQPTGIEEQIRKICISSSGDAYGSTMSYSLTEEQFRELFALFTTTRREVIEDFVNYIEEYFGEDFNYIRDEIEEYLVRNNQ